MLFLLLAWPQQLLFLLLFPEHSLPLPSKQPNADVRSFNLSALEPSGDNYAITAFANFVALRLSAAPALRFLALRFISGEP